MWAPRFGFAQTPIDRGRADPDQATRHIPSVPPYRCAAELAFSVQLPGPTIARVPGDNQTSRRVERCVGQTTPFPAECRRRLLPEDSVPFAGRRGLHRVRDRAPVFLEL